jgi:voltage-gated potassium channel
MKTPPMPPSPLDTDPRELGKPLAGWRLRLYTIIFEADTRAGRAFDLALIAMILASVAVVGLDSMASVHQQHGRWLKALEWFFTLAFTAEYIARLACVRHPWRYARSFFGIIDLLAILPTYLAVLMPEMHSLIAVRLLRLLRIFRLLKLSAYVSEFSLLYQALRNSRRKIAVFLAFVLLLTTVMGALMYVVEGPENGFTSIPIGVYWAITTLTTVGFGDVTPQTDLGRFIASLMMLMGWGTLAVPTGIVSAELIGQQGRREPTTRSCQECLSEGHSPTAKFCRDCGAKLPPYQRDPPPTG